jgi:outer membrane protein TolC
MKMQLIRLVILTASLVIPTFMPGQAQSQTSKTFDPLKDDISQLLPPLSVLIDSALIHDPGMKYSNLQVDVNQHLLRNEQVQWTQDFGLQANVGYGTFDYIYNNVGNGQIPASYSSLQSQTQYNVGGYFRMPLFDVVNRKNQVKLARVQVEQARSLLEAQQNLVRENVIKEYNDLILKQRILKIRSKYLETSKINMQIAEKQFVGGAITVDEYSRVSEVDTKTAEDYETAKNDFLTSYQTLEITVGMKFNLNNIIPGNNEGN